MLFQIDPSLSILWRTPCELQFGAPDPVAVAAVPAEFELQVIERLRLGVDSEHLEAFVAASRAPEARRRLDTLLVSVERALTARRQSTAAQLPLTVPGNDPLSAQFRAALSTLGYAADSVAEPELFDRAALTVLLGHFVIAPERAQALLSCDRPHVTVIFDDEQVRISPVVEPGRTACIYCFERWRIDADPQWPALAAQLLRRTAATARGMLVTAAAVELSFFLRGWANGQAKEEFTVLSVDGQRRHYPAPMHPSCGCGTLPENVTVLEHRVAQPQPSSSSAHRALG